MCPKLAGLLFVASGSHNEKPEQIKQCNQPECSISFERASVILNLHSNALNLHRKKTSNLPEKLYSLSTYCNEFLSKVTLAHSFKNQMVLKGLEDK